MSPVPRPSYPMMPQAVIQGMLQQDGIEPELAGQLASTLRRILDKQAIDERLNYQWLDDHLGGSTPFERLTSMQQSLQELSTLSTYIGWLGGTANITATSDNTHAQVGSRSLLAQWTAGTNAFLTATTTPSPNVQIPQVAAGTAVSASAKGYKDSGIAIGVGVNMLLSIDWYGLAGAISTSNSAVTASVNDTWTDVTLATTVPTGALAFRVVLSAITADFSAFPAAYSFWWDNIHVVI